MVPIDRKAARPRSFTALWTFMLSSLVVWSVAFGLLYSMTNDVCIREMSRNSEIATAIVCLVLAAAPGLMAWQWRQQMAPDTDAAQRARFMLEVGAGASVVVTLLMVLMSVPVFFLDPCRT